MAYYPGCTLRTTAKNFDESAQSSAEILGLDMVELERWNCCGTVHALAKDDVMHYLAPIRNLIRVEELHASGNVDDERVVTLCAMCYNTLKRANIDANNDREKMDKIHDVMEEELEYSGKVEVVHLLEVLKEMGFDKIRDEVVKPLKGLKVAPYYGCLLLRPRGIGIDVPDKPQIMEDLLESLGADVIDFSHKQKCCGSYHTVQMKGVVADLCHEILEHAELAGADILATACPLCEYNLGPRQSEIVKRYPDFDSMLVVYFTQLLALALGLDEESTAFGENTPDPRPLLEKRGLL
ncbi:MAG: CoB--CoM heterodisulfide reductase iron-sulfur subunit B family protein [Candidatus Bathyarchaeia archaeon]